MISELIAITMTHQTAPVEIREQFAFSREEAIKVLRDLRGGIVREAMLLSTCNRTELYALPADPDISKDYFVEFLARAKQNVTGDMRGHFELLNHCDAVRHLFEVSAGSESLIIGDQQIFSQVKEAFRMSSEAETNGSVLTKLAHSAFRVAKRVKTETALLQGAATVSYAAVEFTRKVYETLHERTAIVIGAGETAELAAKHLIERGIGRLLIANRSEENARALLARVRDDEPRGKDEIIPLAGLANNLHRADIVIASTASPNHVINRDDLRAAIAKRSAALPMIVLDIAVPRDVDPTAADLPGLFLKDVDDLKQIVDRNLERRKEELPKAKAIVYEELENFLALQSRLEAGPTIKELRDKFESIRNEELERQRPKLSEREFAIVEDMTGKILRRLLHTPTIMLREPHGPMGDLLTRIEIVRALFALDGTESSASDSDEIE